MTPPASEPVSLALFKQHARANEATIDDEAAMLYLASARRWLERETGRAFLNQTWRQTFDEPPSCAAAMLLTKAPLVSVTAVTSYSLTDVPTVMSNTTYFVNTTREPARIELHDGVSWPTGLRLYSGMSVDYVAGYGTVDTDVPEDLRHAILLLAGHWYEYREAVTDLSVQEIPIGVAALKDRYRLMAD